MDQHSNPTFLKLTSGKKIAVSKTGANLLSITACIICTPNIANATTTTIDFDSIQGIGTLGGFIPVQSRVSDNFQSATGATFSTIGGAGFVGVMNYGGSNPFSRPNAISGASGHGDYTNFSQILVTFSQPGSANLPYTVDFVSVQGFDFTGRINNTIRLLAYDNLGNLIGSDAKQTIGLPLLSVSTPGIASVKFYSDLGIVGYDNFTVSTIPEVQTYLMMLIGLGLVASIESRRRKQEQTEPSSVALQS